VQIKPSKTALLLVDFISPFDFEGGPKLLPRALAAARATAALKARARRDGIACIYANDNYGNWTSEFSALVRKVLKQKGGPGEIAEMLHPLTGDLSILKPRHSAFYGTPLEFLLEELQTTHLIVTGLTTDQCIFATAQDAFSGSSNSRFLGIASPPPPRRMIKAPWLTWLEH
jgi:nicotinamidase-related amidase